MTLAKRIYLFLSGIAFAILAFLVFAFLYSTLFATYRNTLPAYPESRTSGVPNWAPENPDRVRILSIDGGAIWGVAEIEILKALEERSGKPIYELFDFVSGSSTGAVIAALLFTPTEPGGEPTTAEKAIEDYDNFGARVLARPFMHSVTSLNGIFAPRFLNEGRIAVTNELFGETVFKEMLRPALLPAIVKEDQSMKFFRNWDSDNSDLLLASLITAVTSAEAYFPGVVLEGYIEDTSLGVSDPGLVLNSPAHMAYIAARELYPQASEFVVVTVSSDINTGLDGAVQFRGGALDWALPAVRLTVFGQKAMSQQSLDAHSKYDSAVDIQNFLLSADVSGTDPFDPSPENTRALREAGTDFVQSNSDLIDEVLKALEQ